ncbi:hypothetical protein M436DRAFT_48982 [Aureobasidium namibiae CBS 147.97]|uniref:DUF6594 domain-containing protein n=1 Tax=Aureobasidium namibiae CBS 147.97 TaxID=1043004 RepID=A0A074WR06_9PEZI|nr:uncharacterized protein M436DRAFT_48982 [Aureobasidium namibiae CBS 147.97]KEQ72102.1 hypothetical protein M436DRAFT_48982 [Aureobasidium namibiae CBS 147.97]
MRRHGPRKVPGDVGHSKKTVVDETSRTNASSILTTSSEATGVSGRLGASEMPHNQEHQQSSAEANGASEQWSSSSPKASENVERQSQPYQHVFPAQLQGPMTPENAGRPPLLKTDGSASLPSPLSMRSVYGSPEASKSPQSPPTMPPPQNSGWTGQQSEDAWSQGAGRPTPAPIRLGVSLFQQPGAQVAHSMINTRAVPLPQSPRSNIRLEDQMEALRGHIASQQRPVAPNFGGPMSTPGPYWPQMYPSTPQAQPATFAYDNNTAIRSVRPPQASIPPPTPPASGFPDLNKTTLEGYELLAAKLTDGSIGARPMYRSFEHLHHRLLLYLQDEICEYEEELRNLDEWISQVSLVVSEGKSKPASRRAEARILPQDSELMFRRKFVLGEIFVKLERYHRAVEVYCNATKELRRPPEAEIKRYREWMTSHRPVDMAEASFLKHDKDLFVLERRRIETPAMTAVTAGLPVLLLLPFLAFAVMPSFLCRVLAIVVCSMGLWILCSIMDIRHVLTAREWIFSAGIYVAFMTLIAAVPR